MIPTSTRIYVCTEQVDMRRSFQGLMRCTREVLQQDPSSGALFIFAGKRGNAIKILWWDKTGFCILYKRLAKAVFRLPDAIGGTKSVMIDARELMLILEGVELPPTRRRAKSIAKQAREKVLRAIETGTTDRGA